MVVCGNCETHLTNAINYCQYCGHELPKVKTIHKITIWLVLTGVIIYAFFDIFPLILILLS